jgi:Ion channel
MHQKRRINERPLETAPRAIGFKFDPFPAAYCLISLILMLVTLPFIEDLRGGTLIEAVLTTTLLLSAIFAAGAQGKKLVFGFLLATPALIASWESYSRPELMSLEIFRGTAILFFGFVVLQLFWFIVRAPRVDSEVLCAGVTVYLMLGLIWSFAYTLVDWLVPNSFGFNASPAVDHRMEGFQALYFSFITLSTIGYGDIVPVSKVARLLAIVEAVLGTLYVTLFIARLVSLYTSRRVSDQV